MNLFFYVIFFLLGSVVGSFLNVVVFRFGAKSFFGGRSFCLSCSKHLKWHELIPILSFFFLKGRCRGCKVRLSWQYPLVEIVSGFLFLFLFIRFEKLFYIDPLLFSFLFAFYALIFSFLLIISVYDFKHKIIPDPFVFVFIFFAFLGNFLFVQNYFLLHLPNLNDILAGFIVSIPFAFLWFISKGEWIGLGDAKLAIGLGFMLGIGKLLSATIIAFWSGAIIGILFIFLNKFKKGLKTEIPFAPFLIFGTILAFFFNLDIFNILF